MNTNLVHTWNNSNMEFLENKKPSAYAKRTESTFPKESIICDLGGASGADAIDSHRFETYQVDLSEDPLPLKDASIDILYSRLALHYFKPDRTIELLKEIKRVLKKSGRAYIVIKSPEDKKEMAFLVQTSTEVEPGVYEKNGKVKTMYTTNQLEHMLQEAGFVVYDIHTYIENLELEGDTVASGTKQFVLHEMILNKE